MGNGEIKKSLFFTIFCCIVAFYLSAQEYTEYPLNQEFPSAGGIIRVYLPEVPNGGAVIVCPGGGYRYLEMSKEGSAYATWFNKHGMACIVLQYRLPNGCSEIPLQDASQAIRYVRKHAEEWNIYPDKIGIMGSSAGGHVASTLATHYEPDTRPDFQILFYPVITMEPEWTHKGSMDALLGKKATKKKIQYYSNERKVSANTPITFIALSDNDNIVPSVNSIRYYLALQKAGVSCELHVFPTGGHGWGMNEKFTYYDQLTTALWSWLKKVVLIEQK